jgi:hypothetical protein
MRDGRGGGHHRGSPRYSYNAGSAGLVHETGYPTHSWGVILPDNLASRSLVLKGASRVLGYHLAAGRCCLPLGPHSDQNCVSFYVCRGFFFVDLRCFTSRSEALGPRTTTGVSRRWFSGHFRQVFFNTNALPRINIGADVWGKSGIMTGVC